MAKLGLGPGHLAPALCVLKTSFSHSHFQGCHIPLSMERPKFGLWGHAFFHLIWGWELLSWVLCRHQEEAERSRVWGRRSPPGSRSQCRHSVSANAPATHPRLDAVPGPWQSLVVLVAFCGPGKSWSEGLDVRPLCVAPCEQVKWITKEKEKSQDLWIAAQSPSQLEWLSFILSTGTEILQLPNEDLLCFYDRIWSWKSIHLSRSERIGSIQML